MSGYNNLKENIKDISTNCDWGSYYSLLELPQGLCFGLSAMWGQACLIGEAETFYKRLELLTKDYSSPTSRKLSAIINEHVKYQRKMPSNSKSVAQANYYIETKIDDLVVSIRAFLDGLLAYHCPFNTFLKSSEYNGITSLSILKSSVYVANNKLTYNIIKPYSPENFPLLQVYNEPFYGGIPEYANFFENLISKCIESRHHFYILLGSINHAIALSYENGYLLVYDANNMHRTEIRAKSLLVTTSRSYEKLSCGVFNSFEFNVRDSNRLALNVSIYINSSHYKSKFFIYGDKAEALNFTQIKEHIVKLLKRHISSSMAIGYGNDRIFKVLKEVNSSKSVTEIFFFLTKEQESIRGVKNLSITSGNYEDGCNSKAHKLAEGYSYYDIIQQITEYIEEGFRKGLDLRCYRENLVNGIIKQESWRNDYLFWLVCQNGHKDIAELLVGHGANIGFADKDGLTPLSIACQNDHVDIVQLLLARGASPNIASNSGKTPLYVACQKGHTDIVGLLLTCENLNTSPQMVSQYFSGGCDRDSNNMILTSLKNVFPWFNINTTWNMDSGGKLTLTPLIYACNFMDNRSISWLLESYKGSIRDTVRFSGKNALEWYLTHQSQPGYDLQIEQELKKLPR
ncbi:ankyrin-repeat protein [Francisella sp. W12-1067]|nr:ankyrin-repeat protein [Francisella sp. W12-1067]